MNKLTQAFDASGACVFSTADLLRVRIGGDFYIGQKRYVVKSIVTNGEGSQLLVYLLDPNEAPSP